VTGCGGSSPASTAAANARPASASSSAVAGTRTAGATGSTTGAASRPSGPVVPGLAFSRCMRANGVPSFPDPEPGGGLRFTIPAGMSPSTPAYRAAQAKCRPLLPVGEPGPGSATHPTAQTLAKLVRIAECMRRHGVPQFPDPATSVPTDQGGIQEITDFDGAILVFPTTINLQTPAYRRALTACGAPPLGLHH